MKNPVRLKKGWEAIYRINVENNDIGMIVFEDPGGYGVCFGKEVGGHTCGGRCPSGFGQFIAKRYLEEV